MSIQTRERTQRNMLIFVSVSAGIMIVIIIAAIVPAIRKLEQLKNESAAAQTALAQQESTYHRLITLSKEGKNLEEKINFINNLFLTKQNTLAYIQSLENVARERSITLDLALSESSTGEAFSYNPVNLNVQGPWQQVYAFLRDIDKIQPPTTITSLTLQSGNASALETAGTSEAVIAATITGEVPLSRE